MWKLWNNHELMGAIAYLSANNWHLTRHNEYLIIDKLIIKCCIKMYFENHISIHMTVSFSFQSWGLTFISPSFWYIGDVYIMCYISQVHITNCICVYIYLVYSIALLSLVKIVAEQWILAIIFDLLNHVYKSHLTVQFSWVTQSCLTLCDPMDCSTPGLPVHHQLPEFTQTHVHRVDGAIQPSHPLSALSPAAFNLSQ